MKKDKKRIQFSLSHSQAIVGWQSIEINLFLIFAHLIRSQNPEAMSAIYHSVVNFQIRLSMVDSAAQVVLQGKKLLDEWDSLYRRLKDRSSRRNDLVHFMSIKHGKTNEAPENLVLRSSIFDLREGKVKEYNLKQIDEIADSFMNLKKDLDVFVAELWKVVPPPSLEKSPE